MDKETAIINQIKFLNFLNTNSLRDWNYSGIVISRHFEKMLNKTLNWAFMIEL